MSFSVRFYRWMLLVLALGVFGALTASPEPAVPRRVDVYLKPHRQTADVAAQLAAGVGRVASFHGNRFVLEVSPQADWEQVVERLRVRQSVARAEPVAPKIPDSIRKLGSVSRMRAVVNEYKRAYTVYREMAGEEEEEEEEPAEGEDKLEADEIPGLDFLEAYLEWAELRAYPNDVVDLTPYQQVIEQRWSQMDSNMTSQAPQQQNAPLPNWQFLGPTNLNIPYQIYYGQRAINGRVNAIAYDPFVDSTLYLGGAQGGVWKSVDRGQNWIPLTDGWPRLGVSAIEVDPTNSNVIYVGTGDFNGFDVGGLGVMRSYDAGLTWTRLGADVFNEAAISDIEVDPANPNRVVATAGKTGSGGLYFSFDGGANWTTVQSGSDWCGLSLGAFGSTASGGAGRNLYAVRAGAAGSTQLWRSTNHGISWAQLNITVAAGTNNTIDVAASKHDPNTVYVLLGGTQQIAKSTDGGATWTDISPGFPGGYNWSQSWYDYHIDTSSRPDGGGREDVVYVGLIDIVQSWDGGASWRSFGGANFQPTYSGSAITHNDQHSFAVNPNNPNEVMVGNDGGIYLCTVNPNTGAASYSTNLNKYLGISQFYRITTHPSNPDYVLGGTQDNASPHSFGDLANWENPGAGDGAGCAINPFNPSFQYHSWQNNSIARTTTAFQSNNSTITPNWSGHSVPFIGKLLLDPNNGRYLYANTQYLNRWDENTDSWSLRLGNQVLGSRVNAMEVARGDSNRLYTGSTNAQVWMSSNFGANWTRIDRVGQGGGLPNRTIMAISADPNNKNDVLVGVSGTGSGHLWRCFDVTAATPMWVNVSGSGMTGLPDLTLSDVVRHPDQPSTHWYAATDVGVYVTTDAGATWTDITRPRGLPNVEVSDIEFMTDPVTKDHHLIAGTFGRGIWRLTFPAAKLSGLTLNPNPVHIGSDVTGTVTIDMPAPAAGVTVNLSSDNAQAVVPATVLVPAGQTSANFTITTNGDYSANAKITATANGSTSESDLVLYGVSKLESISFSPNLIYSGETTTGTVTLAAPAPSGGAVVNLTTTTAGITIPSTVTVPEGMLSANFTMTTVEGPRRTAVVRGTNNGAIRYGAAYVLGLWHVAPSSVSFTNGTQLGGNLASMRYDDADQFVYKMTDGSQQTLAEFEYDNPTPVRFGSYFDLKYKINRPDMLVKLDIWDWTTNSYSLKFVLNSDNAYHDLEYNITAFYYTKYVHPGTGKIKFRIRTEKLTSPAGDDPTMWIEVGRVRVRH